MKKLFNIFLLFLGFTLSFAQQYPVRLIPVVIPPYSLKLGDYATSTDNKLQLQVLMTDLMEPQHQTGIKFSLQAGLNAVPFAQSNDFVVGMQPFMLYPGSNITLTNVDLRALFELQNLNGINANQYAQPLSDGVYQFCFQAYDFYTKNNLSQKTCATVFLTQYDPPMLNLPQNAEKVQAVSPYSGGAGIVFQWMPRQIAPNTKYIFTLKELWDSGQSPISGFLSSPPLWREETYAPTLYYGVDKTQLIPGKRYAWQVQAKSGNPVIGANPTDDNGVYKNNGLSEIYYFDYVENCAVPTLLMAKNVGRGRVELSWNLAGQPSGLYNVQYRKRGSTSEWQTAQSYQPKYIVTGLEDQTEYEYRIGSVCGNLQQFNNTNPVTDGNSAGNAYAFSGIQYFTTDANSTNNSYQCGVMPAVDIANKLPLQSLLGANEVFTAGDFPVTVISAQGSNGIYSGTGYIVVPYLADTKIKVSFNNIKLNTDKKLIEGVVETTYDPNESAVAYASSIVGELFGDQGVKEVTVDYNISDIKYTATPPPGKITIIGDAGGGSGNGGGSQQDLAGGKDYQIKDKDGNIWNVDENGNVTKGGKVAEGGVSNSTNTDGVTGSGSSAFVNQYTAKGIKIVWEENANGQFAYDTQEKTKLPKDKYPSVKDSDNNTIYVPYKATVNKQTELFNAKVSITDPALKDAKIEFKTLSIGKAIDATEINKTDTERNYQLKLVGAFDYAEEEVIAVVVPKDSTAKQQVISSFRLVHLSPKTVDVSLVPLDAKSDKLIDESSKKAVAIYKKLGVNFNLTTEPVLNISELGIGNTIESGDPKLMSTYGSDQIKINNLYKGSDKRYVLFVTQKQASTGVQGYFRLNGQFGYVFGTAQQKTAAHELGHGVFKLEHPFESIGTAKESTNLLMDYSKGEELSHLDWKQINDPAFKLYAFQSQSSGEFSGIRLTPDWKPFKYEGSSTHGNNTCVNNGGICKIVKDSNEYSYENGDYYYIKNKDKIPLKITPEPSAQTVTVVDYSKGCGKLYEVNLKDLKAKFNVNSSVDFSNGIFKYIGDIACSDDNAPLDENSLGKKFYDQQTSPSMPDAVKTEMMKVAKLVQKMGKDIYNSYVYLEDEEYNPYNYAFNFPIRYPKKIETVEEAQSLYNQLNQHYQNCLAIESRNFKSGDELVQFFDDSFCVGGMMMKATTVVPLLNLTAERRLQLLTLLANNGSMSGNWSISGCPKHENVILYILKTTPNEQTKAVLDGLYNKKLLYYFVDGMDGGNFDQFITILTTWIFKDYKPDAQTVSSALADKRFLLFNDSYFGRLNTEKMNADGGVHLIVKKWFDSSKEYEVNSTPYNYIYVKFQNDFDAGSTKFAKGQTYKLPAIYAYMLMVQDTRSKWKTSGKIVIDVGLCALGVGELKAAIQSGQWATAVLAATDIGIGIGDIVVNTAFKNEIQQAYPNFYQNWQTISTVYGIARLSQIGLEASIKRTNIDAIVMSVDSRLSSEARSTADKIRKQLQNPENFAEYADNLVDDYNRIINESKNLETAEWVAGRTTSGEATNHYLFRKSYNPDEFKPPYKSFTSVQDVTIPVGKKLYCIEYLDAKKPGSWLTTETFNSIDEARNKTALLESFKPSGKPIVIREYTVLKPFNTRQGIAGELFETANGKEKLLDGGAVQLEFSKYNPYDPSNTNNLWKQYLKESGSIDGVTNRPYYKFLE